MKKTIAFLLSLALLCSCCLSAVAEKKKISVVATIFPVYDWAREVIGDCDNVNLILLQDSGVDPHSYQPTVQDIVKVTTGDVFIYVGGESDGWVEGALANAANSSQKVVNLVEAMGDAIKMEEIVEGMEHEHHHDHGEDDEDEDHDHDHDHDHEDEDEDEDHDHEDHDHDHEDEDEDHDDHDHEDHDHDHDHDDHEHDHEHEHEDEADEHVWLSLRNAQKLVADIAAVLSEADPANAEKYSANAAAYIEKLAALDARYAETVNAAAFKTILFGDRFPFRYLADDYGLTYYAAFSGCSAESEASFATVVFLAGKVDELKLPAVLTIENPKTRIAETIVESTSSKNQKILSLDSMQGTTAADVAAGVTYLSVMESNLEILARALN